MPSCTTPTFSKIAVTFWATQPAILAICQVSGSAMATTPTGICPLVQSQTAATPVPTTMEALSRVKVRLNRVISRSWRRKVTVCSSTAARTNSSSSRGRAKSFTVRMLV